MSPRTTRQQIILRSNALHSDDFGALFARLFGNLYADAPPLPNNIVIGGVYGRHAGVSFRRMHYRGDFSISLPALQDEITFVLPTAGTIICSHGSESIGDVHCGLAIDKCDVRAMRFANDHAQYGMSIDRALLTARLATLLERPLPARLVFEGRVDLRQPAFQGIKALLELATGDTFDQLLGSGMLMPARLQEMLIDAVLEAWPHNFSQALLRPNPMIAPRHVKLAVDYLQAHPQQIVSGAELAQLSNVSQRALQDGFRRFMGTSIVSYQRQVRLEHAHRALRQDCPSSVTEVANSLGFSNVGRFCQYFHNAYGVSPADVRKGQLSQNR